ncbi:PR domain zinc finger protein 5-like isoform X6 [Leguminivora glycinivorella]|uniref:PR domain zinc finger protein 5-like isoform X6 n=1 Tax=Leguminivora glycinivorella TaxID=1035111 RepID=UPI00200EC05F|nr:PR domain zinc finger protein 5-like isoform X6 [Leguminivora glycinivorella]
MSAMWKLEKDLCRCCHAEGSFKHLSDPCFLLGQEEIYSVMLKDCLDIKIVPMTGPLSDATYTICEACVGRLRDASNFKRQVQDCEQRFKEMYSKNMVKGFEVKAEPFEGDAAMKQESRSVDESDDDDEAFMKFDDELSGGDTSYEEHEEAEEMITVEIQGEPSKGKGKLKARRKTPNKRAKKEKPIKTEGDDSTEATASGEKKKDQEKHTMKACYKCKKIRRIEDLGETKKCPDCATVLTNCVVRLVREQLTAGPVTNFFITTDPVNDGQAKSEPQAAGSSASDPAPTSVLRNFLLRGAGNSKTENESETSDSLKVKIEDSDDDSLANLVKKRDKFEVYGCKECQKTFDKKSALQKHIRSFHRKHTFNCPDCPETFPTKRTLQTHAKKVHDKNTGVEKGMAKSRYAEFMKVTQGENPYACRLCDFACAERGPLLSHIRSKHLRQMACPICDQYFPDQKLLDAHKTQPHHAKYSCTTCNLNFTKKELLTKHNKWHHDLVKCSFCPERMLKKDVKQHLKKFHEDKIPTCGICGFKGATQALVVTHQRKVHLKEKNVSCTVCKFKCFDYAHLTRHMISHKVDKVYTCRFCKKTFPRRNTCRIHEMIHTGEKNKVCDVCGAKFVQKASLNYHMLKHHPDHV